MAEPLKNMYNESFFQNFTDALQQVKPDFDKDAFLKSVFTDEWETKELKQRMRHITVTLKQYLPSNFKNAVKIILELNDNAKKDHKGMSFGYMCLPDYIELYGLDDFDTSINAFEKITPFASCEFAVRPFIIKYQEKLMQQMLEWSTHEESAVRRFSSEGCRPRLPWAIALSEFKKNPEPIIPILENLKNDESDFVRKSVANNLNDISKDNPEIVIDLVKKWQNKSKNTNWIIKHGSRTLLKNGNQEVMKIFGFGSVKNIYIKDLKTTPKVKIDEDLHFFFQLINNNLSASKIRLEYGIYYLRANGTLSKKVFKISEKEYFPKSTTIVNKKQSFRIITTKKFYPGKHQISIIVNGIEKAIKEFYLE